MKYIGKNPDEIFVGNVNPNRDLSHLKSLDYRLGSQALDIHGNEISEMLPLFIKFSCHTEYDRIMIAKWRNQG